MEGFVERHFECVWVADGKYIRGREAVGEEGKYVSGSVESSAEIDTLFFIIISFNISFDPYFQCCQDYTAKRSQYS